MKELVRSLASSVCDGELIHYCCYCIERQQIVADIERLTSDKTDLLTRLQCCEEDLKTASECENCVI